MTKKPITIKHSGFLGDLVASLPSIRGLSRFYQTEVVIYIFIDKQWVLFSDGTRENEGLIDANDYEFIRELLMGLPFISDVRVWRGEHIHYDYDKVKYRGKEIGMPHSNLSRLPMYIFPESSVNLSERTINIDDLEARQYEVQGRVDAFPQLKDSILVSRSLRWINPYINYVFLNNIDTDVYFIGTLREYDMFMQQVPKAKYIEISDALSSAIAISSSKLFIGNQSLFYNISELIKTNRLLECCGDATNIIPQGDKGYDFYTQEGLEQLVSRLIL